MGIKDGFMGASIMMKIAFILLILAALFVTIGFTCTGWAESSAGTHWGLWRRCSENEFTAGCTELDGWALGE
jgi:hypothetical protein